jgi:hypothetical protein
MSGVIFVGLAVGWAVDLIPKALKHHDEVARTRSVDRFSHAMRVLARREPVNHRDTRLVLTPARAADNPRVLPAVSKSRPAPAPTQRAAARAAARRRRRILGFLLLVDLVVAGLAGFVLVPWWAVAIPVALTLLYLVLCRTQVRRENLSRWEQELEVAADAEPVAQPTVQPVVPVIRRNEQGFEEVDPNEDTISMPAVLDAVAVPTEDGGSLWDPLPMTLPTYVDKPAARRTVRTIDLTEPGTWTSGRTEEDSKLVAEAASQESSGDVEPQQAVGS